VTAKHEAELFDKADIAFVAPERRESADDLKRKKRVRLVETTIFAARSTFTHLLRWPQHGRQMLAASRERGFDYVGISDHSKAA
jgi:hypothetical protein